MSFLISRFSRNKSNQPNSFFSSFKLHLIVIYFSSSIHFIWMSLTPTVIGIRSMLHVLSIYCPWLVGVNCENKSFTLTLRCFLLQVVHHFVPQDARREWVVKHSLTIEQWPSPYVFHTRFTQCTNVKYTKNAAKTLKYTLLLCQNPCDKVAKLYCYKCRKIMLNNQRIYACRTKGDNIIMSEKFFYTLF